jgi:hypothetical protein
LPLCARRPGALLWFLLFYPHLEGWSNNFTSIKVINGWLVFNQCMRFLLNKLFVLVWGIRNFDFIGYN